MAGPLPEQRVPAPVLLMGWKKLTFLHWSYPPEVVQALLPDGLRVDTWDGRAWVAITPFLMTNVHPPLVPPVPGWSTFPETNVRTYVRAHGGSDGLWFLSLDAGRAATLSARAAIGVPYAWSRMSVVQDGRRLHYTSRRVGASAHSDIRIQVGEPIPAAQLTAADHFLTGRWRAFSRRAGRTFVTPVEHQPWPLHAATVEHLDSTLIEATGLPSPTGDPVVHYSPAVDVRMGRSRLLG
jgi:uncharacterized protein YqjF (DUF2071 family)